MLDSLLQSLGEALRDDESRRRLVRRILAAIRRFLTFSTVLFVVYLAVVAWGLMAVGEHNVTTGFLLYVPRTVFLLPAPVLLLITIPFHWKMAAIQLLFSAGFAWLIMGWQIAPRASDAAGAVGTTVTLLTYNRGENMNQSLQPFKNLAKPDVIVLQEAGGRAAGFRGARGYEEFPYADGAGEFTIVSRFPIVSSNLIKVSAARGLTPVAARFELDVNNQRIAVYSVHIRSPRDELRSLSRGAFLYGVLGAPGTPFNEKRKLLQAWWDDRLGQLDQLLSVLQDDPLPVLVGGDFNAPAGGIMHRRISAQLTDAHLVAGQGLGYTFPGSTRNLLSLGGPWMRIDYLLCREEWRPLTCITEEKRPSQHRAVAATFILASTSQGIQTPAP
jgi:endonuclease/exonuclease/phosphatase (EEP) superfamily protein YafD